MSYGSAMTSNIPTVGASGTQYATDVNEFLTEVQDILESKVPFSALQGDELDMNNVPLIDAKYVALYDQSVTPVISPAGRFESYQGNVYWVNTSGAVRLTNGAAIDITTSGGIGGDYGTGPEGFNFVNASARYDAYDNATTGAWAYFRSFGVDIAAGSTSSNMAQLRYGGAASLTFTFPATLPGSNRSVMVISSAGQMAFNDSTNTVTNDIVLGGTTKIVHGSRVQKLSKYPDIIETGTLTYAAEILLPGSVPFKGRYDLTLQEGQKLTGVTFVVGRVGAGTATLTVRKSTGAATSDVAAAVSSAATGTVTLTVSGMTEVIASGTMYHVNLELPTTSDSIQECKYTYQQDA